MFIPNRYHTIPYKYHLLSYKYHPLSGADPGFQVRGGGGGALKKIAPSGGRRENCWGISCEKSRFYAMQNKYHHEHL